MGCFTERIVHEQRDQFVHLHTLQDDIKLIHGMLVHDQELECRVSRLDVIF